MGAANILRLWTEGLKDSERLPLSSGDAISILPQTDDTGSIAIGNGTYDMDFVWYGGSSTVKVLFDVGNARLQLAGVDISSNDAIVTTGAVNAATFTATTAVNTVDINLTGDLVPTSNGAVYQKIVVANANCTLNASHWGALVINKNAVDKIYTLPDASAALAGVWFEYASGIGQNTTFTANTANTILALNFLAANSVALNTANEIIGATCKFVCDGSQWIFMAGSGTATVVD